MNITNIICFTLSVILSGRWVTLMEGFSRTPRHLLEQCQLQSRAIRKRYVMLYAVFVVMHIAAFAFLIRREPNSICIQILFVMGEMMTADAFVRMSFLCRIIRLLFRTLSTAVKEIVSSHT